jgi:hypothetical protein
MIHIPKNVLNKLKFDKKIKFNKDTHKLEKERAEQNTKDFNISMEVIDKIGKEIGEMREWAPYCSDANTYMPFPLDILKLSKQQLLQLLIHAYGTAAHLKEKLDE